MRDAMRDAMRVVAAVDIGGTGTKLGVVGAGGRIVARATVETPPRGEPAALLDAIDLALRPMIRDAAAAHGPLAGLGVSVAGFLDAAHDAMIENPNLPALEGFPLRAALEERFSLPCTLEVDSNAAALAEYVHGTGKGARRLLGVTVGTGLGGGVIVDGELLRFTGECAGDIGHIIVDPGGRSCPCGARGCLEAMVSSAALTERAGGRAPRETIDAARAGDRSALDALTETGRWLGLGLASLAPLFAPDTIVVGGGIAAAGDVLLNAVRESFVAHAAPAHIERARIVGSSFEGWEGLVGASCIVHREW